MTNAEYLRRLQGYVANVAISGSTLRNQGASKMVEIARTYLSKLKLHPLRSMSPRKYRQWLDKTTNELRSNFPARARKWGSARKVVNIFMAQAFLNRQLCAEYRLTRLGDVMEAPLDSTTARQLRKRATIKRPPRWIGVGRLTPQVSDQYQAAASELARRSRVPRASLDVLLWRQR